MNYSNNYAALKELYISTETDKEFDTIELHDVEFVSESFGILPGIEEYKCNNHNVTLEEELSFYSENGIENNSVHIKDIFAKRNRSFKYQILKPKGKDKVKRVVFLFHGFNERDWSKYLPWAKAISDGTDSAVVLFPLAFHMQRAPKEWSNTREMFKLSEERKQTYPNIENSSLTNVAISTRLHAMPHRALWSGLQTYNDVLQLMKNIKKDNNEHIDKDAHIDIFSFSVGGFLAQVLKMTNFNNYFKESKVFLFCSGATFNNQAPSSKFILDSETDAALYAYLVKDIDEIIETDPVLRHYLKGDFLPGKIFYAMLDYNKEREFRESMLKKHEHQIYAISLTKDDIVTPHEIVNTLKGANRDIDIRIDELDFEYNYIHENPFPVMGVDPKKVDESFEKMFEKVLSFYNE
ncbi:MAG: hypothetical protein GX762_06055 [Bacteroidales bacterium]|jgi:hypothetical protein|nr:hypothetical protein [Bacteroidales bacterium]